MRHMDLALLLQAVGAPPSIWEMMPFDMSTHQPSLITRWTARDGEHTDRHPWSSIGDSAAIAAVRERDWWPSGFFLCACNMQAVSRYVGHDEDDAKAFHDIAARIEVLPSRTMPRRHAQALIAKRVTCSACLVLMDELCEVPAL